MGLGYLVSGLLLLVRRLGILLMVIVGILWLVVLLRLLLFFLVRSRTIGGLPSILLFAPCLTAVGGLVLLLRLFGFLLFGMLLGCLLFDKSRGSKSVEVRRVWEIFDERLQFMSRRDALLLNDSLAAE